MKTFLNYLNQFSDAHLANPLHPPIVYVGERAVGRVCDERLPFVVLSGGCEVLSQHHHPGSRCTTMTVVNDNGTARRWRGGMLSDALILAMMVAYYGGVEQQGFPRSVRPAIMNYCVQYIYTGRRISQDQGNISRRYQYQVFLFPLRCAECNSSYSRWSYTCMSVGGRRDIINCEQQASQQQHMGSLKNIASIKTCSNTIRYTYSYTQRRIALFRFLHSSGEQIPDGGDGGKSVEIKYQLGLRGIGGCNFYSFPPGKIIASPASKCLILN